MSQERDHLFISYAWEDVALAEWLTLKLTTFGYRVWCDRIKLLGGESFPTEIDNAIKDRTHRLIALLSKHSLNKPNPLKERTLALALARERKCDFMIPLNLGLKPTELPWMLSDLTYIDFARNWADGLDQLQKALQKVNAPCPLADGRERVCQSVIPAELTTTAPELLTSNHLPVSQVPEIVTTFESGRVLPYDQHKAIRFQWPSFRIDDHHFLAFHHPPQEVADQYRVKVIDANNWRRGNPILGADTGNVVPNVLRLLMYQRSLERGLVVIADRGIVYFPQGLIPRDELGVVLPNGVKTRVGVCGERMYFSPGKPKEKYVYHLAATFSVCRNVLTEFAVRVGMHLFIQGSDGTAMSPRSALSRQKRVTHDWWNYEWMVRHLAVCQFLGDSKGQVVFGERPEYRVMIEATPFRFQHPMTLNDADIVRRRKERRPKPPEPTEAGHEPATSSPS